MRAWTLTVEYPGAPGSVAAKQPTHAAPAVEALWKREVATNDIERSPVRTRDRSSLESCVATPTYLRITSVAVAVWLRVPPVPPIRSV